MKSTLGLQENTCNVVSFLMGYVEGLTLGAPEPEF